MSFFLTLKTKNDTFLLCFAHFVVTLHPWTLQHTTFLFYKEVCHHGEASTLTGKTRINN